MNYYQDLKDATVVVTGCNGFLGRHLINKLAGLSKEVIGIDLGDYCPDSKITYLKRNICLMNERIECDYLFHLAAITNIPYSEKFAYYAYDTNVLGTLNLMECIKPKRRIVFFSAGTVYGTAQTAPFKEDGPVKAMSVYGASKLAGEELIRLYGASRGFDYSILRLFNMYGPGQVPLYIVPQIILEALKTKKIQLRNGSVTRDFVYAGDLVEAAIRIATVEAAGKQIVNVGSGVDRSLMELANTIKDVMGDSTMPVTSGSVAEGFSPEKLCASTEKAKKILGWEASTSLRDGIAKTVEWYKKSLELSESPGT
jgi:nucleoside-diphosphate-sugar epimerase